MSPLGRRRPLVLDEADTVAYTGKGLAELLESNEMRALSHLDVNVESTVVIPGSTLMRDQSSISIAPVAYSVVTERLVVDPMDPAPAPARKRTGVGLIVGAIGVAFGLVIATSFSGEPDTTKAVAIGTRQTQKRESASDKTPLVAVARPKAAAPLGKRHGRFPIAGIRAAIAPAAAGAAAANPAPPARSDENAADEALIRAAQLERPL